MPIEVRELVIKATVEQENGSSSKPLASPGENNSLGPNEGLIQACIDKITEILKNRHER